MDAAEFASLFERHGKAVLKYAWTLADDRTEAHDIAQEAFLVAWRRRADLPDEPLPWLLVTARNIARDANRRRRRKRTDELVDAAAPESGSDELSWIHDEIAALPPLERQLVQLCLVEGVPYNVASARLGLTPAAARKRMQRIRERLRAARGEGGGS